MAKNTQKAQLKIKITFAYQTSYIGEMYSKGCFIEICYGCFRANLPHPSQNPHQIKTSTTSDVCAKFHEFKNIPSPSKTASVLWQNASPWQQHSMKTIFTIKHHQGVRVLLTKFEGDMMNLLGVVHRAKYKIKYSAYNFLVPVRGAMIMSEFCYVDVFRPGLLSSMWHLWQIWPCTADLQLLLIVPWWHIEICRVAKATPLNENSQSSQ